MTKPKWSGAGDWPGLTCFRNSHFLLQQPAASDDLNGRRTPVNQVDEEETLTAYHEAGHAVMAYALGGDVDSIQLGGEVDDWLPARFGDCRIHWGAVDPDSDWQRQRELLTIMAGPVAEMIYRGEEPAFDLQSPSQNDWQRAWLIAGSFVQHESRRMQFLLDLHQQLEIQIRSEPCWSAIAAVADELAAHEALEAGVIEQTLSFWFR